jgi:hypothetical protein
MSVDEKIQWAVEVKASANEAYQAKNFKEAIEV